MSRSGRKSAPETAGVVRRTRLHASLPEVFVWIALAVAGVATVALCFPRVFPVESSPWTTTRDAAVEITLERLRDLGEPVLDPYVTASLQNPAPLEMRLRTSARAGDAPVPEVQKRLSFWSVRVFERGAPASSWSYVGQVALNGQMLALIKGVPPDYESPAQLTMEQARERADRFLSEQGFDLTRFGEPTERRVQSPKYTSLFVRYPEFESQNVPSLDYGVEVRFVGDRLHGFFSWWDDPGQQVFDEPLRLAVLSQTAHIFVLFLIIPIVAFIFVRRYHEGLVGVQRATYLFVVVLVSLGAVLVLTARPTSDQFSMANLTRPQVTWLWIGIQLTIYVPAVAFLAFASFSSGESLSHGAWRLKLASFDALLRGQWQNSTVASSSLRGVAAGLVFGGGLMALLLVLQGQGVWPLWALFWGPWWENAVVPGVTLFLVNLGFSLAYTCFGMLLVLTPAVDRFGVWLGGGLVTLLLGVLYFPPVSVVSFGASMLFGLLGAAVLVALYLTYDFTVAFLAGLTQSVLFGAWPLVRSEVTSLQFQGFLALSLVAVPLFVSARFLGRREEFQYQFDDVPAHVRRIAERERQKVEIETARRIQSSILPELPEIVGGVEVAHTYLPASEVGGDFYDVIELADGRLSLAIGDVAGHGVSSGLVMSMARAALTVQVGYDPEVGPVFETLNRVVYRSARRRLLTTLCYVLLDPKTRTVQYASAGHLYPYCVSEDGSVRSLRSTAYPLGVRENLTIEERDARLEPGDTLFLSSDGLVEARRVGTEEMFGFDRLEDSLSRYASRPATAFRSGIVEDLEDFIDSGLSLDSDLLKRDDDLTLLVAKVF